jgi:putative ABC transport system permease protein
MLRDSLYLAGRYLAYHRFKTAILVLSITLIVYVPVGLRILVAEGAEQLTRRAEATPLIVGSKGSPLELVLKALYFESEGPEPLAYEEVRRIQDSDLALPIPLHARFMARGRPILGTSLDYFAMRGLQIAEGRQLAKLGECVLGARVAAEEGLVTGDKLNSSPESVFDLAGVYPLRMRVVGVLEPSGTADDRAIFVDLKTAWVIEGLGHGHRDLQDPDAQAEVLGRDESGITANAAVLEYNEITEANAASFHFHGDQGQFPITAVIALPSNPKNSALLRGRYLADDLPTQILRPIEVMEDLLGTIFTVQGWVVAALVFVGCSTLLTAGLVFVLSLRLRRREIETMIKIGGAKARIASVLGLEIAFVILASVLIAGGLSLWTLQYGSDLLRSLILS